MSNILSIFIFLLLLLSTVPAFTEMKTFAKEYTYQASDMDSKVSCRTIALEQVKRLLLEELGTYLESTTEVRNHQLTKDQITVFAGGVVQTRVIDEKWDGKLYRVKVEITADPNDILKSINELREKNQLSRELVEAKKKVDDALKEIERLKTAEKTTQSGPGKLDLQKKYEKEVEAVYKFELWQKEWDTIRKGAIAHDKGNYDEAIYISKVILANQKSEYRCLAYNLLGFSLRKKGMYQEAIDALNMTIKLCSNSNERSTAQNYLGGTYLDMKLYKPAISEFKKALTLLYEEKKRLENQSPSNYDRFYPESFQQMRDFNDEEIASIHLHILGAYLGIAQESNPNASSEDLITIPKEGMLEFDKVLTLKPNSLRILRSVHEFGGGRSSFLEIVSWCDKLAKLRPDEGEIYFIRGSNYIRLENYKQAIKDCSSAIELNPNVAEYYERRGAAYLFLGIVNQAFKDFDTAINLNPTFAAAYFGRGVVGTNKEQAFNDYKIAARLGHEGAQQILKEKGIKR